MKTISLTTRQSISYVDMHYFSTAQALWAVQGPQPPKRSWSLCWHAYFLFARLENFRYQGWTTAYTFAPRGLINRNQSVHHLN